MSKAKGQNIVRHTDEGWYLLSVRTQYLKSSEVYGLEKFKNSAVAFGRYRPTSV
ncbi:MAG: hypothetical protein ACI97N_000081 [Cognaticolwellia sp.]|jgi:hypothetical protein